MKKCQIYLFSVLVLILVELYPLSDSQKIKWEDSSIIKEQSIKFESDSSINEQLISKADYGVGNKGEKTSKLGSNLDEVMAKKYFIYAPWFTLLMFYSTPNSYSFTFLSLQPLPQSQWDWTTSLVTPKHLTKKPYLQFPNENPNNAGRQSFVSGTNAVGYDGKRSNLGADQFTPALMAAIQGTSLRINKTCACGTIRFKKDSNHLQRIVGGVISEESSWPWMVAIAYMGQKKPFWFCGGSLISDKYVLTAAHCLKTIRNVGLANVKLIMGANNLLNDNASIYYSIRAIRPHPLYKAGTEEYDIAMVEVKEKVSFTIRVAPICLKQESDTYINRTVTVAGWGTLQNGNGLPADLREVNLKVVSNGLCEKEYYYNYRTSVTSAMLCAWLPGKDSCQGDSGGPLFLKTNSAPQVYTQIGIVSFGPPQCGTTTVPGVYTRIAVALNWIKSVAKGGRFCQNSF